jgi:hypothetical protein
MSTIFFGFFDADFGAVLALAVEADFGEVTEALPWDDVAIFLLDEEVAALEDSTRRIALLVGLGIKDASTFSNVISSISTAGRSSDSSAIAMSEIFEMRESDVDCLCCFSILDSAALI